MTDILLHDKHCPFTHFWCVEISVANDHRVFGLLFSFQRFHVGTWLFRHFFYSFLGKLYIIWQMCGWIRCSHIYWLEEDYQFSGIPNTLLTTQRISDKRREIGERRFALSGESSVCDIADWRFPWEGETSLTNFPSFVGYSTSFFLFWTHKTKEDNQVDFCLGRKTLNFGVRGRCREHSTYFPIKVSS